MAVNPRPVRVMVQAVGIAIFAPAVAPIVDQVVRTGIAPMVRHPVARKELMVAIAASPMINSEIVVHVRLTAQIILIAIEIIGPVHQKLALVIVPVPVVDLVLTDQSQVANLAATITPVRNAKIGAYLVRVVREILQPVQTVINLVEMMLEAIDVAVAVVLVVGTIAVAMIEVVATALATIIGTIAHPLLVTDLATIETTDPPLVEIVASQIAAALANPRSGKIDPPVVVATIAAAGKIPLHQKSPRKKSLITSLASIRSSLRSKKNAKSTKSEIGRASCRERV